jgi:hypothetical protein
MRAPFPPIVALVLAAVSFGGCVGGSATAPPSTLAGPAFDEATGSIRGSVRTEEIQPIVGAQVGIVGTTFTALTDESGAFSLNFVTPGRVTVTVVALGFQTLSRDVDVVAGQVADAGYFVLLQLGSDGPYHTTGIFRVVVGGWELKATPDCMYFQNPLGGGGSSMKTCQGSNTCDPVGMCEIHYGHCGDEDSPWANYGCDLTTDWKTILSEAEWTPGTFLTGRGWSLETLAPNITRSGANSNPPNPDRGSVDQSDKHDWWVETSKNPIYSRIDTETFELGSPTGTTNPVKPEDRCGGHEGFYTTGHCDWVWRIFMGWCTVHGLTGGLAGCEKTGPDFAVDTAGTPITIYFSYFIHESAPEGWSAIPDA